MLGKWKLPVPQGRGRRRGSSDSGDPMGMNLGDCVGVNLGKLVAMNLGDPVGVNCGDFMQVNLDNPVGMRPGFFWVLLSRSCRRSLGLYDAPEAS